MTNERDIAEIMKSARDRITSENTVPVTVARMPAEEVAALLDEIAALKADAERHRCALEQIAAIEDDEFGDDWGPLETAREIARAAMNGA